MPVPLTVKLPSAAHAANGNSGEITALAQTEVAVDINVTELSGTTPAITFYLERRGTDDVWYELWASSAIDAPGVACTSVGRGLTVAKALGAAIRLRWAITGTNTPTATFSASLVGK